MVKTMLVIGSFTLPICYLRKWNMFKLNDLTFFSTPACTFSRIYQRLYATSLLCGDTYYLLIHNFYSTVSFTTVNEYSINALLPSYTKTTATIQHDTITIYPCMLVKTTAMEHQACQSYVNWLIFQHIFLEYLHS